MPASAAHAGDHGRPPGRGRLHRQHRRAGTSAGLPARDLPTGTEDRTSESRAGEDWAILSQGLGIKKYPTCYCTHRAIDCMLDLVNSSPIKVEDVEGITVNLSDYFATVLRNHQPETGLAAKFSIEFCMASGIVAQRVGLRELTDGFVQRPDIQALMRKVEIVTTTTYDPDFRGGCQ